MERKKKIAKGREKRDMSAMSHLRDKKVNPLGRNKKLRCSVCGRPMLDNRYHDKCQECYFQTYDVTLKE